MNYFKDLEAKREMVEIGRRMYEKAAQSDTDALMAELEALRALKAEKEQQENK